MLQTLGKTSGRISNSATYGLYTLRRLFGQSSLAGRFSDSQRGKIQVIDSETFSKFLGFESFCEKSGWMWYASISFYLCPWFEWSWPVRLSSSSAHSQFTSLNVHYSKTAQLEICFKSMSNDAFFARNRNIPKWSNIKANATRHSRTETEFTRTNSQNNFITITFSTISTKNFTDFLGLGSCSGTEY